MRMNPFEMIVLIVAVVMVARVLVSRHHSRSDGARLLEFERMQEEIARLKDRVSTLERLATDRGRRLADEIDALGRHDRI
jgi:phage shock protein A